MDNSAMTERDDRQKSDWVTPELTRMGIEQTLTGRINNPSETMSGNPSGNVPGSGGS